MTIRIAHMSDLHYCAENLAESDRCFSRAVTDAILEGVDCAIITGDSSDHALDAHTPSVRALAAEIKRLADHCPVLMLQGTFSHEPPGFLKMLAMVGARHPITVADRISSFGLLTGQTRYGFVPFKGEGDFQVVLHCLPTLNKADIASLVEAKVDEAASQAREIVSQVLHSWGPVNANLRERGIPSMVLSHGTVFNSISEHGVPMAGTDHELGLGSLFAAGAHGVALGHIHKHQSWHQVTPGFQQLVAYAGSIGRFHHGEQGDKFWLLWSLSAEGAHIQTNVTPARTNVDLVFEGPPDLEEIRQRADSLAGAFVRIRYCIDEEFRQNVDRAAIRLILEKAADVQIEGRTLTVQRQRAQGISSQPLSEKLATWANVTGTDCVLELQQRLQLLQDGGDIEGIVDDFVQGLVTPPAELIASM